MHKDRPGRSPPRRRQGSPLPCCRDRRGVQPPGGWIPSAACARAVLCSRWHRRKRLYQEERVQSPFRYRYNPLCGGVRMPSDQDWPVPAMWRLGLPSPLWRSPSWRLRRSVPTSSQRHRRRSRRLPRFARWRWSAAQSRPCRPPVLRFQQHSFSLTPSQLALQAVRTSRRTEAAWLFSPRAWAFSLRNFPDICSSRASHSGSGCCPSIALK